VEAYKAEKQ